MIRVVWEAHLHETLETSSDGSKNITPSGFSILSLHTYGTLTPTFPFCRKSRMSSPALQPFYNKWRVNYLFFPLCFYLGTQHEILNF